MKKFFALALVSALSLGALSQTAFGAANTAKPATKTGFKQKVAGWYQAALAKCPACPKPTCPQMVKTTWGKVPSVKTMLRTSSDGLCKLAALAKNCVWNTKELVIDNASKEEAKALLVILCNTKITDADAQKALAKIGFEDGSMRDIRILQNVIATMGKDTKAKHKYLGELIVKAKHPGFVAELRNLLAKHYGKLCLITIAAIAYLDYNGTIGEKGFDIHKQLASMIMSAPQQVIEEVCDWVAAPTIKIYREGNFVQVSVDELRNAGKFVITEESLEAVKAEFGDAFTQSIGFLSSKITITLK